MPFLKKSVAEKPAMLTDNKFTNFQLVKKAGKAIIDWSGSGFASVSDEQLEKREAICLQCQYLREPKIMLQQIVTSNDMSDKPGNRLGNKVCGVCGCSVKKKIKMSTEICPISSTDNPGINLWGESVGKIKAPV